MKLLSQLTNNILKNYKVVTYKATNKALGKTNTRLKRTVSQGLKLKSKDIAKRSKIFKANKNKLSGAVSFGVKWALPLNKFKFRTKVVTVNKRKYKSVAVRIGNDTVVEKKNFVSNNAILHRTTKARLPVKKSTYSLLPYVDSQRNALQGYLRDEFKTQVRSQIKYLNRR